MTHQLEVLSAQKCSCLSRCVRARIVVVNSGPSAAVGFPDFLEDNWQTNGCVPLRIDWWTGDYLLGSASCASNFCWIWLILKHPYSRLLFIFRLICVNLRFIMCHDVIDEFRSIDEFLEHFFRPIDTNLFLSDWQHLWDSTWIDFFGSQMFKQ